MTQTITRINPFYSQYLGRILLIKDLPELSNQDLQLIIREIKVASKKLQRKGTNVTRATNPEYDNLCMFLSHVVRAYKVAMSLSPDYEKSNGDLLSELKFKKRELKTSERKLQLVITHRAKLIERLKAQFGERAIDDILEEVRSSFSVK